MHQAIHRRSVVLLVAVTALVFGSPNELSALELNRSFSNDMVLQRDKALNIWGTARKGATVTVAFSGQTKSAKPDESGRWQVTLDPMPASRQGAEMVISSSIGSQQSRIKNVLVGDVLLFARQSSIDVSLGATPDGRRAAAALAEHEIYRFVKIKTSPSRTPRDNLKPDATGGWQIVDRQSALAMSAAAFYLGRDLTEEVNVPVGIVDLDMGYHLPGAWLSKAGVELAVSRQGPGAADLTFEILRLPIDYKAWDAGDSRYRRTKPWPRRNPQESEMGQKLMGMSPAEMPHSPSVCYNAVIHPLRGMVVKGMLLQLGNDYPQVAFTRLRKMGKIADMAELAEANKQSYQISKNGNRMTPNVLSVAPADLRRSLGDTSLPMAWIMPPGSDVYQNATHNREVREVQRRARSESEAIDLILPGAEHIRMSGQPADETLLASRCKQWARATFYGAEGPASGPLFDRFEFGNETGTCFFKPGTADGLSAEGEALKHFEVAATDGAFFPCSARVDGTSVKLTCDEVPQMAYVRYGWMHKPAQGLVNSGGLPALPFNTDPKWEYDWWPDAAPVVLPNEYHIPASKWPDRDVAIVNLANVLKKGSQPVPSHLGPTGVWIGPFGPNLYVHKITPDSPADGKVLTDDLIYGVNGKDFGPAADDKYRQIAAAITLAESEAGAGKMVLSIRRKGKLIEVPIELEVLGSYSATSPWHCKKSKRIIEKAEEWMRNGLRPKKGKPRTEDYTHGPFHVNALFLLASGNPELQGLVRRYIRQRLDDDRRGIDPSVPAESGGIAWEMGYLSMLLGEYYHRTGDSYVLPYLEWMVDTFSLGQIQPPDSNPYKYTLAVSEEQVGAFRGGRRTPGKTMVQEDRHGNATGRTDYGLMPACDMPGIMGFQLAREAGLKVDELVMGRALKHLNYKRAEYGFVLYAYSGLRLDQPAPIDLADEAQGLLSSMNGKLGTAAALFSLLDGYDDAVTHCSHRCAHAFNRTRHGHGGMWFNNYWTPIGAFHAGEAAFQDFMKGQLWWRELYRDHSGAVWQAGNSKGKGDELAVAYVTHRVAHHKRLRILGAPRSAFGPDAPAYLKDALAAHRKRAYALAVTLVQKELAEGGIPSEEQPMVRHFLESVQVLKQSVEYDLSYTEALIKKGEYYYASLELPQLTGVVAPGNTRLRAIGAALESEEGQAQVAAKFRQAQLESDSINPTKKGGQNVAENQKEPDDLVIDGFAMRLGRRKSTRQYPEDQWNRWRMKVLETPLHAPEGWFHPDHDDSDWDDVTLPIAWRIAHAALLRTTFEVEDVNAYESLVIRASLYKQNNLRIYLNGQLVAKVNHMPSTATFPLTPYALEVLKNGSNALAVITEHGKRNVNFSLRIEGHLKDTAKAGEESVK
jgi:sialate O-acetylesterase